MAEFDESLVTTEAVTWNFPENEVAVRYDGQYAGIVKRADDGDYFICDVRMKREGQITHQACGRADSIKDGAKTVGHQFFLWNNPIE